MARAKKQTTTEEAVETPVKKTTAKKTTPAKKTNAKPAAKKAPAKKAPAKKAPAKKAPAKKAPAKKTANKKTEANPPHLRGRKAGVRYKVKDDYKDSMEEMEVQIIDQIEEFSSVLFKFTDGGNKTAAANSRACLQNITKICKDFRKTIQDAKVDMEEEKI